MDWTISFNREASRVSTVMSSSTKPFVTVKLKLEYSAQLGSLSFLARCTMPIRPPSLVTKGLPTQQFVLAKSVLNGQIGNCATLLPSGRPNTVKGSAAVALPAESSAAMQASRVCLVFMACDFKSDHAVDKGRSTLAIHFMETSRQMQAGVPLFNENNKIERHLNEDEVQRLLGVLRTDDNRMVCHIALFLLSTGARLNEALQAKWGQIDRGQRVWRISAEHSKSKRMRSVPLNDSALEVLDQLCTEGKFANLFINQQSGKPYTTIMKVWTRLREKAGLPDLRIHDLRHQFASFLVNSGRSLYEVQQILGHSDPSVTQR